MEVELRVEIRFKLRMWLLKDALWHTWVQTCLIAPQCGCWRVGDTVLLAETEWARGMYAQCGFCLSLHANKINS